MVPGRPPALAAPLLVLALLGAGCRPRTGETGEATARKRTAFAGRGGGGDGSAPSSARDEAGVDGGGRPAPLAAPIADEDAPSLPLLVVDLGPGRAAILLGGSAAPEGLTGKPKLLASEPIVSAAVELPESRITPRLRAARAKAYRLGALAETRGPCSNVVEKVVDLARIVSDDPTMEEGHLKGDALAARAFEQGAHAIAALLSVPAHCAGARWAVPEGERTPAPVPTRRLEATEAKRIEAMLARTNESYRALPSDRSWKRTFTATKVGEDRAWVMALRAQPGSPLMVCALVDTRADPPKVLAETSSCPETVVGASEYAGQLLVWFAHAVARVSGDTVTVDYVPTASFAPYGAP